MKKFFNWLFGWMGRSAYNRGVGIEGKSEIFYLAPKSLWHRVKSPMDICVSKYTLGGDDPNNAVDLSWYFFPELNSQLRHFRRV